MKCRRRGARGKEPCECEADEGYADDFGMHEENAGKRLDEWVRVAHRLWGCHKDRVGLIAGQGGI
jgi:hypothetical protein